MAFPTTGILDNFNRADESPATGWSDGPAATVYMAGGVRVLSNVLAPVSGDSWDYYNVAQYGPDCEVYATVSTYPVSTWIELGLRGAPINNTSMDHYHLFADGGLFRIKRADNSSNTQLGADITRSLGSGDALGLEAIGSTLTAYYKASGGSWASQASRTDSTYIQSGSFLIYIADANWRIDDFGGGTVVTASTVRMLASTGVGK